MSVVHHWICQQPTMFQGFLQSRLKWGLNIEQPPVIIILRLNQKYSHNRWDSSMLFQRQQCFQTWANFLWIPKNWEVSPGWWGTPSFGQTLLNCALWLIVFFCGELPPIFVVYLGFKTSNTSKIYNEYICHVYLLSGGNMDNEHLCVRQLYFWIESGCLQCVGTGLSNVHWPTLCLLKAA